MMEENGVVGPAEGSKPRAVLVTSPPLRTHAAPALPKTDVLKQKVEQHLALYRKVGKPVVTLQVLDKQFLETILEIIEDEPNIDLPKMVWVLRKSIFEKKYRLREDFEDFAPLYRRKIIW